MFADGRVTVNSFGFGLAQLAFAGIGLDGHPTGCDVFVDVDLDRRPAVEVPPGALLTL